MNGNSVFSTTADKKIPISLTPLVCRRSNRQPAIAGGEFPSPSVGRYPVTGYHGFPRTIAAANITALNRNTKKRGNNNGRALTLRMKLKNSKFSGIFSLCSLTDDSSMQPFFSHHFTVKKNNNQIKPILCSEFLVNGPIFLAAPARNK